MALETLYSKWKEKEKKYNNNNTDTFHTFQLHIIHISDLYESTRFQQKNKILIARTNKTLLLKISFLLIRNSINSYHHRYRRLFSLREYRNVKQV